LIFTGPVESVITSITQILDEKTDDWAHRYFGSFISAGDNICMIDFFSDPPPDPPSDPPPSVPPSDSPHPRDPPTDPPPPDPPNDNPSDHQNPSEKKKKRRKRTNNRLKQIEVVLKPRTICENVESDKQTKMSQHFMSMTFPVKQY
jgi:hypothetical protein